MLAGSLGCRDLQPKISDGCAGSREEDGAAFCRIRPEAFSPSCQVVWNDFGHGLRVFCLAYLAGLLLAWNKQGECTVIGCIWTLHCNGCKYGNGKSLFPPQCHSNFGTGVSWRRILRRFLNSELAIRSHNLLARAQKTPTKPVFEISEEKIREKRDGGRGRVDLPKEKSQNESQLPIIQPPSVLVI